MGKLNPNDRLTCANMSLFGGAMGGRSLDERAHKSRPVRNGTVIKSGSGGRKFISGKKRVVWKRESNGDFTRTLVSKAVNPKRRVAQWSPKQVEAELRDLKSCSQHR